MSRNSGDDFDSRARERLIGATRLFTDQVDLNEPMHINDLSPAEPKGRQTPINLDPFVYLKRLV